MRKRGPKCAPPPVTGRPNNMRTENPARPRNRPAQLRNRADPQPSPNSPSIHLAKPPKTLQKPTKNPHFAPAGLTLVSPPTPAQIDSYVRSLPQSRDRATFFRAQPRAPARNQARIHGTPCTSTPDFAKFPPRNRLTSFSGQRYSCAASIYVLRRQAREGVRPAVFAPEHPSASVVASTAAMAVKVGAGVVLERVP